MPEDDDEGVRHFLKESIAAVFHPASQPTISFTAATVVKPCRLPFQPTFLLLSP